MIKDCLICGESFTPITASANSRSYCYSCVPHFENVGDRTVAKRRAMKLKALENLGGKCLKCDESRPVCIDFHHVDSDNKTYSMASLLGDSRVKEYFEELQKCIPLCSNCHREFHSIYGVSSNEEDIINYIQRDIIYWKDKLNREYIKVKSIRTINKEIDNDRALKEAKQLLEQVRETSFEAVGRLHGVSGNAIKKRLQRAGLPHLMSEIRPKIIKDIPKKQNWRELPITLTIKSFEYSFETGYDAINYIVKNNDRTYSQASEGLGRVISGKRLTYLGYKIGGII